MSTEDIKEKTKQVKEQLEKDLDINNMDLIRELLRSNEFEFIHLGEDYKVSAANYRQKKLARTHKNKEYMRMLNDKIYLFEKDLRKQYKENGVDIDAIEKNIRTTIKEKEKQQLKLGEALEKKLPEKELNIFKEKIAELNERITDLSYEKTGLLEPSIENQCLTEYYSYLAYLTSQKKVDNKWVQVWVEYEDFLEEKDESLMNQAIYYSSLIVDLG